MREFAILIPLEIYQKTNHLMEELIKEKGSSLNVKEMEKAYEEKYGNIKIKSFILTNNGIEEMEKAIMNKSIFRFFESKEEKEKIIKDYGEEYHIDFTKEDFIYTINKALNLEIPMKITKEFTMKDFSNAMNEGLKKMLEKFEIKTNDLLINNVKDIYLTGTTNALYYFLNQNSMEEN